MVNVTESIYAEWLEEFIKNIMELKPTKIGVCAVLPDGSTMTSYFGDVFHMDKAMMAYNMNLDAIWDVTTANAKEIVQTAEEIDFDYAAEDGEDP